MTALILDNVDLRIGSESLFDPVSIVVPPGVVAVVSGPSGAGKSSLLAFISGTLPVALTSSGRLVYGDEELTELPAEVRGIGILFQDPMLFPHFNVRGNLLFGMRAGGSRRERRRRADAELDAVGLGGFGDRDPFTLSGGQKARVAILRVLLAEPRALLLDEPFTTLDNANRCKVREFVFSEIARRGLPAILVTHDSGDAAAATGPVIRLAPAEGSPR